MAASQFTVGLDLSALNVGFKEHALRGIGRYVSELKSYLDRTRSSSSSAIGINYFDYFELANKGAGARFVDRLPLGKLTLKQQLLYPIAFNRLDCDTLHFPAHMDAPAWGMKNYALTVLDLIPFVLSDLYRAEQPNWRFHFARWLEVRAIKNASLIMAISDNTAHDLHRVLGIPYERIVVTPLGVDSVFGSATEVSELDIRARHGIPRGRQMILYVGGIDQRKNWPCLLETLYRLKLRASEQRVQSPILVMAGRIDRDRQFPKMMQRIVELDLSDDVVQPGFVRDEELRELFAISSVFFFPSLYEGFGLTPLEAMAAGVPVVSSGRSAMREVLDTAAHLVDPEQYGECAAAIWEVLGNREYANVLREKGRKRAQQFSWSRTGEKTLEAYERFARLT